MMILSYLGHAYVYGKPTLQKIPAILAVPWHEVATKLGRPPVLSYESYALDNWRRIDPDAPIELGNIALLQNFLGGMDEEWFILIHVDIEARAGALLGGIERGREAVIRKDLKALENNLNTMGTALSAMYATLARMPECCDPYIYFNRVRPYIHGWKNHPGLPNGMLYEGVNAYNGQAQFFRGETGAQSSIIPSVDGFLGVCHQDDPLKAYLMEMRDYMPPKHRSFLAATESGPSTREIVKTAGVASLKDAYNTCVDWVDKFRSMHLNYAISYISKQAQVDKSNPSQVGTGGTPFVQYLTKHRDETGVHKL